jgi:CRISP-associated protein Cas1
MQKLLNTLFVSTQGSYLLKEGQSVIVNFEKSTLLRLPIHAISGIVCFGNVAISPYLLDLCMRNNVYVSILSKYGRFIARIQGPISGNVLLRRSQYRKADLEKNVTEVAYAILIGKIANSKTILQRALRDHKDKVDVKKLRSAIQNLNRILRKVDKEKSIDELRGFEGDAAHIYFRVFNNFILSNKDIFIFTERSRRPPLDPVNALLSFTYTLLVNDVCSALESVGLDPAVGFLHRDRPGRPSLALDLMEEFRTGLADRFVLSLMNRNQIKPEGFSYSKTGSVIMDDENRKTLIVAWQKRKQDEIKHPFLNEKMQIGITFHIQARLFAKYIKGEFDNYPPFYWR